MGAVEKDTKPWIDVIDFENRRYPRFDIHLPIEYYHIKSSFTHTGNISESGLLVYFPVEMDVNQYLRLKLFFPLGPELNTIKVSVKAVWMDNHLSKEQEYYPYGVKFVDISPEDGTKLRNFLRSLSFPLDDTFCLYNTLRVRFWIRKFINPLRGYIPGRQRLEILSLVTKSEGNRRPKRPVPSQDRQF
ncbi:MAG TPA: PilZ domain-containing protein [Candidatus Methanoperedens sp.]